MSDRIAELEAEVETLNQALLEEQAENARLQRALDAANIVRGNDPTLPDVAVEREEIEG